MTIPERAASPTQLRLGPRRNVWIGLQHRWTWAVAFNMQGLETTEQLLLLLCWGFTPRPLLYLRIGRMQLEAVCDGIFTKVVSHAWVTRWLRYVRTLFCKQGEPGGLSLSTSRQGFTNPTWPASLAAPSPQLCLGKQVIIRAWGVIQTKQNLSSLQKEPAVCTFQSVHEWRNVHMPDPKSLQQE